MDTQNKELKSVLVLKNLYFEKVNFERDIYLPKKFDTSFSTEFREISHNETEVRLQCLIKSDTKFTLDILLVGVFENNEEDEEKRNIINKVNTVSIMFPYLRSEISLVTAQPNFPTIDLPIININELLKAQGKLFAQRA